MVALAVGMAGTLFIGFCLGMLVVRRACEEVCERCHHRRGAHHKTLGACTLHGCHCGGFLTPW